MKLRVPRWSELSISTVFLAVFALFLLIFKLGSLTHGNLAAAEQPLPSVHASVSALWQQPLNAPFTLVQLLVALILPTTGVGSSRLPAVLIGAAFLLLMYWLLRQWYGQRLTVFSMLLLVSTPWFLHVARLATPDILYPLAMLTVLALGALWHRTERPGWLLPFSAAVFALLLYVPGAIWLSLILVVLRYRNVVGDSLTHKRLSMLSVVIWAVLIMPLLHWLLATHNLSRWLGYSGQWPGVLHYLHDFVAVWFHIFIGHWQQPLYNVGGMPVIDIAMTIGFLVGLYLYAEHLRAPRTRFLVLLWLAATALIALPGGAHLSLLLPIVVVFVTGGLGYLLHRWLKVFPRNPLARGFGMTLIFLVVAFAVLYNLVNYYEAWPHNLEAEQTFSRQL